MDKNDCSTVIFTNFNVIRGEMLLTRINYITVNYFLEIVVSSFSQSARTFCILHSLEREASKCLFP